MYDFVIHINKLYAILGHPTTKQNFQKFVE